METCTPSHRSTVCVETLHLILSRCTWSCSPSHWSTWTARCTSTCSALPGMNSPHPPEHGTPRIKYVQYNTLVVIFKNLCWTLFWCLYGWFRRLLISTAYQWFTNCSHAGLHFSILSVIIVFYIDGVRANTNYSKDSLCSRDCGCYQLTRSGLGRLIFEKNLSMKRKRQMLC